MSTAMPACASSPPPRKRWHRSRHEKAGMFKRLPLGLVLADTLIGCSGGVALKPIQAPCPGDTIDGLTWSPDNTKVAFFTERVQSPTWSLQVFDLTTGTNTHLADVPQNALNPQWSPDSSRLLSGYD